ncbi:MAG: HAD-IIB family hydrolase [Nanobdellota archaeon]
MGSAQQEAYKGDEKMFVLATDLDRTLFPNGLQEYDESMSLFSQVIKKERPKLIYVTGRNIEQVKEGMKEFHAPMPDHLVLEVGTKVYNNVDGKFVEDEGWIDTIKSVTSNWNVNTFRQELSVIKSLRLQEEHNQNRFKLSYYLDDPDNSETIVREVTRIIKSICEDACIVYSEDETHGVGLLDILPKRATKVEGLEYLRRKLGFSMEDIVYSGDSGNDILPLTYGYRSILVRNAKEDVRNTVRNMMLEKNILDRLHLCKGYGRLNGHYVSGILEGLIHFALIDEDYIL